MAGKPLQGGGSAGRPQSLPPEDVIFGRTGAMRFVRHGLEKVCPTDIPVLIQGDVGTGKEVLARWIHSHSPRSSSPFVKVNCAAIPGTLLESELFGYQEGAFTGAYTSKPGRVELASGGTLFLDEIGELEPLLQAKLLQILQDGQFSRLGDQEERWIDARVICASSRRVEDAVREGHFRQDLYYRINTFTVDLPPLSARREDIPLIGSYLLGQLSTHFQRETLPLSPSLLRLLQRYEWRGNIRELENVIARYVLLGAEESLVGETLWKQAFSISIQAAADGTIPLKRISDKACRELGRELILEALEANHWNRRKAAEVLKISYRNLLNKIREVGLPPRRPGIRASKSAGEAASTDVSVS